MKIIRTAAAIVLFFLTTLLFSLDSEAVELYRDGQNALRKQDYYGAIDSLQEALRLNPAYLDVILALADAYFRIEEYEEAYRYIEQAALYGRNDISLLNMKARILVGREELDDGEALFRIVLSEEPNNLEANLGLAEISLLRGDRKRGEEQYRKSLVLAPESRRALLSLALLYDREGNRGEAENYLNLALTYHSRDPEVYISLAEHYLRTGDLDRAAYFAQNGSLLSPDSPSPFRLLGQAFMEQGQWLEAVDPLVNALSKDPSDVTLLYMISQCYIHLSMDQAALKTLDKALRIDPNNEIVRITMEQFLINNPSTTADQRSELAAYHREKGTGFEKKLYYERAYNEFRRSRWIDPYDWDSWQLYGRSFKLLGFPGKYLNTLQAMEESGYEDRDFQETLMVLEHRRERSLADRWGVDQYDQVSFPYGVSLYSRYSDQLVHTGSEEVLTDYLSFILLRYAAIDPEAGPRIRSFSQAFSSARESGSDYFVILDFSETERTFLCRAELYLSSTGTKLREITVMRTGKNRINLAMEKMASDLESCFVPRTRVLAMDGDEVLLGLGRYHNMEPGEKGILVKGGSAELVSSGELIDVSEEDVLGAVTILETDEEVSSAHIDRYALFDLISRGDEIYFLPEKEDESRVSAENPPAEQPSSTTIDSELKTQLLRLN